MANWKLGTARILPRGASGMQLDLEADGESGSLKGTLTYTLGIPGEAGGVIIEGPDEPSMHGTITYNVWGGWVASYSQNQPDKKFSVFSVWGNDSSTLPTQIAADGTMTGPGDAPTQIRIKVNTASSQYGSLTQDSLSLTPV